MVPTARNPVVWWCLEQESTERSRPEATLKGRSTRLSLCKADCTSPAYHGIGPEGTVADSHGVQPVVAGTDAGFPLNEYGLPCQIVNRHLARGLTDPPRDQVVTNTGISAA